MYQTIFELPTQVLASLDPTDAETWMNVYNSSDPQTPDEVKDAKKLAWRACMKLPSSFSFTIVASTDTIDKAKDIIDLDSIKEHMDSFIDYGGNIQNDHGNYNVGTIWSWRPIKVKTDEGKEVDAVEVNGNLFGGDMVYDNVRRAFAEGGMNNLSVAGEAAKGVYECDERGCYTRLNVRQLLEISVCTEPMNKYCRMKWYNDRARIVKSASYLYPYDVIVRSLDTKIGSNATDRFLKNTVSFKKSPAFTLQDMIKANQEQYRKNSSYIPLTTIDLADMSQFNPASMDDETKKLFNALIYNILLADYNINRYGENGDFEKISYTKKPWAKYFQTNKPETTTEGEVVEPEYYGSNDESKGMMTQRMIDLIDKKAGSGELDFLDKDENSGITPASLYAAIENNSFNDVYKPYDDAVKIAEALKDKGIDIGSEEAILLPYLESLGGRFKYMAGKYGDKNTLTGYLTGTDKNKGVLQYLNPTVFKEFASKVDPGKPYESLDGLVKGGAGNRLVDRYVYRGPGSRKPIANNKGSYNYYDPTSIKDIPMGNLMKRSIISGMTPDLRRLVTGTIPNDYELPENPRTLDTALNEYDNRDTKKDKEIGFDPSAGITNLKKDTRYTGEYGTPEKKSVVSKTADTPSKSIINTGNSASDDIFYVNEFREIFKITGISAIISNPKILVGAMADKKFKKVDINIMRGIVSTSSELLIRILKKEKCNIHAVSKQISDDTGIDADRIEKLLNGINSAVQ